jgi:tetratricopeptide (TPR) repeat protein
MFRLYISYSIIFIFTLSICACSLVPGELKTAEQLIETAPDSALHILQNLSPGKYKSASNRALYGLLMIQTLDKNLLPLKPDSLLDYSIQYYENHPDKDRLAACYLYKGRSYKYAFQYEKAMNSFLKALDVLANKKNYLLLARINTDLGQIYLLQSDYLQSREKYRLAFDYFNKSSFSTNAYYSLINIGITYYHTKEFKLAQKYFHKVYNTATDSMTKGAALDEIGLCYYKCRQYDSALIYLRKVINYPFLGYNRGIRYYYLSRVYFDLNQIDTSYFYAYNSFKYNPDIRTKRECYRILTNSEFRRGHMREMSMYMNKYVQLGDSIRKIDAQAKGSYIESMHNTKQEVVKARRWIMVLYIFLLLVISASVYIYIIKRRRNKQEKLQAEQIRLQQKIDIRKEVVMKKREMLLRKIEEKKAGQEVEWKKAGPEERCNMIVKMYDELLHLNDVSFFQKEMDAVLNNLVNKLKNRYPALTEKEINWCCFYLLNIPTEDIMVLFDYKVDSLKRMKQRLVNKVRVAGVSELDSFLKAILYE